MRNKFEVQDVFNEFGTEYRKKHKLPLRMHKVMNAIESCRTEKLGGHVKVCDSCGTIQISHNSCRNRHCPKCQGSARDKWIFNRKRDLLPIDYFHVVFTVPDSLNSLFLINQREMYNILFRANSETLLELAKEKLHAEVGFISILHTWGQNLMDHPHIHNIVTGGGLSSDEKHWISSKKKFLIHVNVLSGRFKDKFLYYLEKAYDNKKLQFEGKIKDLGTLFNFKRMLHSLKYTKWVVYCKPPFSTPENVLEYIGRYSHRVAISNNRIINIESGKVTFKWRDYKDGNKIKLMTINADEFIRRFLLHVLPERFVKIRYYGLLGNRKRRANLKKARELLNVNPIEAPLLEWADYLIKVKGIDFNLCPCCREGRLIIHKIIPYQRNGPSAAA